MSNNKKNAEGYYDFTAYNAIKRAQRGRKKNVRDYHLYYKMGGLIDKIEGVRKSHDQ